MLIMTGYFNIQVIQGPKNGIIEATRKRAWNMKWPKLHGIGVYRMLERHTHRVSC